MTIRRRRFKLFLLNHMFHQNTKNKTILKIYIYLLHTSTLNNVRWNSQKKTYSYVTTWVGYSNKIEFCQLFSLYKNKNILKNYYYAADILKFWRPFFIFLFFSPLILILDHLSATIHPGALISVLFGLSLSEISTFLFFVGLLGIPRY